MSKSTVWFGYLDAGAKSSAVAIDERLNTGNPNTVYVFNLARGKILEYKREIAEEKLRDLEPDESSVLDELKAAFEAARRDFHTRGAQILNLPERGQAANTPERSRDEDDTVDEEAVFDDLDIDLEDADEDLDELDEVEEM
jgi:hypothetical protein